MAMFSFRFGKIEIGPRKKVNIKVNGNLSV